MNVTGYLPSSVRIRALSPSKIKQNLRTYCLYLLIPILENCTGQVCVSEKANEFFFNASYKTVPHTL